MTLPPAARRLLLALPTRSASLGGTERQTALLARLWAAAGAEVFVASEPALRDGLAPLLGGARWLAAPGLGFDPDLAGDAQRARQAAALRPALLRRRPDAALVALPLPGEGLGAMLACAELGVPVLGHAHLVPHRWSLGDGDRAAAASLAAWGAGWAAVSEPAARRLEGLFGLPFGAAAAVPNGLPDPRPERVADRSARRAALRVPAGARLVLMLGTLDERKGAHLAPAIARRVAPDVLALAGEGPLRAALAADAPGNLRLLGPVPDPRAWLAVADAFLLPSRQEGCPLALLEAAAEGVPILASREALEAWGEEGAGRMALVVPRDAAAIAEALRRPADPARIAAAREAVASWDAAAMARRLGWLLAREAARRPHAAWAGLSPLGLPPASPAPRLGSGLGAGWGWAGARPLGRGAVLRFGAGEGGARPFLELRGGEAGWILLPPGVAAPEGGGPLLPALALLRGAMPLASLRARREGLVLALRAGAGCEVVWEGVGRGAG